MKMLKINLDPFLNLSDKAKKIIIVCLIVLSSIFISGFNGVSALTEEESNSIISELKNYRGTASTSISLEQVNEIVANFSKNYNVVVIDNNLYISKGEFCVFASFGDIMRAGISSLNHSNNLVKATIKQGYYSNTYGFFNPSLGSATSSSSFGITNAEATSLTDIVFFNNCDLYDSNGNVVFQAPVDPLISHQLMGGLPEMMMEELSVVLPIGLVLLSVGLLIFLLNHWRKSLNL